MLTEPDQSSGKGQKAKIASIELVETREDAAIVLDFVDETFNQLHPRTL
jgi:hypothetical protein